MVEFAKRLLSLTRPYRFRLALGVAAGMVGGLLEPLLLAVVKFVIDTLFPTLGAKPFGEMSGHGPAYLRPWIEQLSQWIAQLNAWLADFSRSHPTGIRLVVFAIPLVVLLRGVMSYLNIYFLQWVSIRTITDLRSRLFGHLLRLPLSFFHENSTGELLSRITSDTATLQGTLSNSVATVIKDPVTLLALLGYLLWQSPQLTLVTLVVFPACIIPVVVYSRKVRKSSAAIQTQYAEISKIIHEAFTGNRIIKAYNLEDTVIKQFSGSARRFISHFMRVVRSMEIPGPLIEFVGSLGVAGFFLFMASHTAMTPTDLLTFVGSIFLMYRPIKTLARLQSQLVQARAASERVFELLAIQPTIRECPHPQPLRAARADIHFDGVHFRYKEKPVLRDIQLTVPAGRLVALVGRSGSGKTTLTNLLLRFYEPQQGVIRIGGTDISQVALRELRDQVAVVTQETILFDDSIRNNIALGRPGATEEEIVAAAQHAFAHEYIRQKSQGYDTLIGERGVTLSGGERQRLAIARAILKNAPILVLDEATSALDTESERAVQSALEELMHGRTTICIAHRLSTIQNADLIVVLSEGRIVETGVHAELIQRGGQYQKLYELQFPN